MIVELTGPNMLDELLQQYDQIFVVFTSTHCPHCTRLLENLKQLDSDDLIIAIANTDYPLNHKLAFALNVRAIPTMIKFVKGLGPTDYLIGYSSIDELKQFIEN